MGGCLALHVSLEIPVDGAVLLAPMVPLGEFISDICSDTAKDDETSLSLVQKNFNNSIQDMSNLGADISRFVLHWCFSRAILSLKMKVKQQQRKM